MRLANKQPLSIGHALIWHARTWSSRSSARTKRQKSKACRPGPPCFCYWWHDAKRRTRSHMPAPTPMTTPKPIRVTPSKCLILPLAYIPDRYLAWITTKLWTNYCIINVTFDRCMYHASRNPNFTKYVNVSKISIYILTCRLFLFFQTRTFKAFWYWNKK